MTRYHTQRSYNHDCEIDFDFGGYWLTWTVDYYYADSRLRYPRQFRRDTDEAGARRFCKRWGIEFPETQDAQP